MISPYVWEATLPVRVPGLVRVLARVHALLDDWLFAPFVPLFDPRMGRPSTPMETYLPMMSQVPLTGWDTRAEAYTKAFKEVENPAVVTSKAMVPTGQFEVYSNSLRTPGGTIARPGYYGTHARAIQRAHRPRRTTPSLGFRTGQTEGTDASPGSESGHHVLPDQCHTRSHRRAV